MIRLTNQQYLETLQRLCGIIQSSPLEYFDDDTVGCKDTQCSWGLCSDSLKLWPTADLHLFPEQFPGRSSPKYREDKHVCPFDEKSDPKKQLHGCFYYCRVFQRGHRRNPSREEALSLLGKTLEKARAL